MGVNERREVIKLKRSDYKGVRAMERDTVIETH